MSGALAIFGDIADGVLGLFGDVNLGGVPLSDIQCPDAMKWGGEQQLAKQVQPGGRVFLQSLGPRFEPLTWSGFIEGPFALAQSEQLYAMLLSGAPLPLAWFDRFYTVVVKRLIVTDKYVNWLHYEITCEVLRDESVADAPPSDDVGTVATDDGNEASDSLAVAPGAGTPATPRQGNTLPTPPIPPDTTTPATEPVATATPALPTDAPQPAVVLEPVTLPPSIPTQQPPSDLQLAPVATEVPPSYFYQSTNKIAPLQILP